jgi:hypothetical protein
LKRLRLNAEDAIAVEDSLAGVQALQSPAPGRSARLETQTERFGGFQSWGQVTSLGCVQVTSVLGVASTECGAGGALHCGSDNVAQRDGAQSGGCRAHRRRLLGPAAYPSVHTP